jgi:predicted RecA/RadA family phage recombinase
MAVTTNTARSRNSPPRVLNASVDTLDEESRSVRDTFERDIRLDGEGRDASVRINKRSTVDEGREGSVRLPKTDNSDGNEGRPVSVRINRRSTVDEGREGSVRPPKTDNSDGNEGRPVSVRINRRSTVDEGREGSVRLPKTDDREGRTGEREGNVRINRRSTVDEGREGSVRLPKTDDREGRTGEREGSVRINRRSTVDEGREGSVRLTKTNDREGRTGEREGSVRINRRSTVDEGREGSVRLSSTVVPAEESPQMRPRLGEKSSSQRRRGGTDGDGSNFPVVEREIGDKETERQQQIESELAKERAREALMNIENKNPSMKDDAVECAMDALFPYMKISAFSSPRYPNLSSKVSAKLSKKPSYDSDASRKSSSRKSSSAELLFEHSIDGTEVDVLGNR